jgi:hypothetical protein
MHAGCILAHLNLVVSVATSYIYDLGRNAEPIRWAVPALADANRCGSVLSMASPSPFSFDPASHILLKACFLMVGTPFCYSHHTPACLFCDALSPLID